MSDHDYYWELNMEKGAMDHIGPKRTIEFFLDAVRRGRQHLLELYDPVKINDFTLRRQSLEVIRRFKIRDKDLEQALAQLLTNSIRFQKTDKDKIVTEYLVDLLGRFVWNPKEDVFRERACEYASFKASGDYITLAYGMRSKPCLIMTKAEAACLKKTFSDGKRTMGLQELLANGRRFYAHASKTANRILSQDSSRLTDKDKRVWERRALLDEKISKKYHDCLEILRTAHYKFFN